MQDVKYWKLLPSKLFPACLIPPWTFTFWPQTLKPTSLCPKMHHCCKLENSQCTNSLTMFWDACTHCSLTRQKHYTSGHTTWGSTMTATTMTATMTMTSTTMMAINHDDQLGEIYPTMLNELNCTFVHSALVLHVFIAVAVMANWPWFVAVVVCCRHGI